MEVYNVRVTFLALVRADDEIAAIQKAIAIGEKAGLVFYDDLAHSPDAFVSDEQEEP